MEKDEKYVYPADLFGFEDEVFDLYMKCKFIEALKLQGKILSRRRGHCRIYIAEDDIAGAFFLAGLGNIQLNLPSYAISEERSMHANATWRVVDAVVKAIEELDNDQVKKD